MERRPNRFLRVGLGVGAVIGIAFGLALGSNSLLSMVFGAALGLLIGAIWDGQRKAQEEMVDHGSRRAQRDGGDYDG